MNITEEQTVGNLVAADYRTASVFKSLNIDFCCKGNKTIKEVCERKGINLDVLIEKLMLATIKEENNINYQMWPIDLLADYIEKIHHRYVDDKVVEIVPYLEKVCQVHGQHHPELLEIKQLFLASAADLAMHMKKEELIIFPYIRKMVLAIYSNNIIDAPHFGTVKNPINMMMADHTAEGERFAKIEQLTNNYTPPAEACNTYKVTYALLKEFEDDLHMHIHLENNILFPKAIELETNSLYNAPSMCAI